MKITYTARKMDLTDALKDYAEKKLHKLSKFFDDDAEIAVTFINEKKERQVAEATVHNRNTIYRVEDITTDMYVSIDKVVAGLERQIRKHKTKLEKRLRAGAFDPAPAPAENMHDVQEMQEHEYEIVRTKRIGKKPMSAEEAVLQMNLLGHDFFIYINDKTNDTNLVYRRRDGKYGLIEVE